LPLSLSFRVIIGCHEVISQISLELVVISDTLHAPDNQLLIKVSFIRKTGMKERGYLCPGVEILHDLSYGDPTFETFVLLDCSDFSLGWFSA